MDSIEIVIYGASGFGREVAWLAENCQIGSQDVAAVCFVDDDESLVGSAFNNLAVLTLDQVRAKYPNALVVSGIGVPNLRERTMEKARAAGFDFATLISPRTEMSRWIQIGDGSVICAGNILTTNITIGNHVQINLDCTIGHDVVLDDYATLAPGVHVSGCVHVGKRAYIGTGAVINNGTKNAPLVIGDDVVIGSGACVTKSVSYGTWGGCLPDFYQKKYDADRFDNWQYPEIEEGKPTKYNWVVQNVSRLKLGYKTDIGAFTYINAQFIVIIEDYVQIGSHCSIYSVSTINQKEAPVLLKKNCRVGSHSVVMPGVTIGENAVIGAFSFVTKDIPSGEVWAGVPARPIGGNAQKSKKLD